jgi:hypothetical protein
MVCSVMVLAGNGTMIRYYCIHSMKHSNEALRHFQVCDLRLSMSPEARELKHLYTMGEIPILIPVGYKTSFYIYR